MGSGKKSFDILRQRQRHSRRSGLRCNARRRPPLGSNSARRRSSALPAMTGMAGGREFDLIREFLGNARKTHAAVQVGPGDDCAVLGVAPFAISTDMSVENIHFRRDWLLPQEIGYRAAMSALSDLAAVGAQPVAALVSFAFTYADADGWA